MSYDNNYNDNDYTNSQWQGSTWSDNGYQPGKAEDPISSYGDSPYEMNAKDLSKLNFEENVLSQSFVFMAIALLITALTSFYIYNSPRLIVNIIYNQSLFYGLLIAELVVVFVAQFAVRKNAIVASAILFTLYSVINGATLSIIFVVYTPASIASTFLITAIMFGGMAVYGLVTKKDLSSIGSLCMMALLGIIATGLLNTFVFHSSGLEMGISVIGILIFVGLTAYDAQKIKQLARYTEVENVTCIALLGALELYLDFINIFLKLLMLMGRRRD